MALNFPSSPSVGQTYPDPPVGGLPVYTWDGLAWTVMSQPANLLAGVQFIIDGGGVTILTGLKGYIEVPFTCTIKRWTLLADVTGSIVVDIWKDVYANFPPVVGDVITASAKPTISSAQKGQSNVLTGWTTAIGAGDILAINVNSITSITKCTLSLQVAKN